jgi:hypothetical protein
MLLRVGLHGQQQRPGDELVMIENINIKHLKPVVDIEICTKRAIGKELEKLAN